MPIPPDPPTSSTGATARVGTATSGGHRGWRLLTRKDVRFALRSISLVLVFFVLGGATYQGVSTALERRHYPRTGGLIDVGGYQLHLFCMGTGTPTVLLEAPAGGASVAWARIQPALARTTRTCSYDRAGLGWSERGDEAYDPARVPAQLGTLLARADVRGPFVLVGEGLGAAFATMFAARYPDSTAALVLIDLPSPAAGKATAAISGASPWLARVGLLRATKQLSSRATGLPEPAAGALAAFLNRPDHLTIAARELSRWDDTVAAAAYDRQALPSTIPVTQVAAAGPERVAFLVSDAQAAPVVAAVADVIRRLRGQ